jgi:hypothetical protein
MAKKTKVQKTKVLCVNCRRPGKASWRVVRPGISYFLNGEPAEAPSGEPYCSLQCVKEFHLGISGLKEFPKEWKVEKVEDK